MNTIEGTTSVINSVEFNNTFNPDSIDPDPNNLPESEPITTLDSEQPRENDNQSDSELPEKSTPELLNKLELIPVFTIANEEGAPLVANQDEGGKVGGVFLSQEDANNFLVKLSENNPELANKVKVIPVTLAEVYRTDVTAETSGNDVDFTYVAEDEAVESASTIVNQDGKGYEGGVPLFVARGGEDEGYLTVEQNSQ